MGRYLTVSRDANKESGKNPKNVQKITIHTEKGMFREVSQTLINVVPKQEVVDRVKEYRVY